MEPQQSGSTEQLSPYSRQHVPPQKQLPKVAFVHPLATPSQ